MHSFGYCLQVLTFLPQVELGGQRQSGSLHLAHETSHNNSKKTSTNKHIHISHWNWKDNEFRLHLNEKELGFVHTMTPLFPMMNFCEKFSVTFIVVIVGFSLLLVNRLLMCFHTVPFVCELIWIHRKIFLSFSIYALAIYFGDGNCVLFSVKWRIKS